MGRMKNVVFCNSYNVPTLYGNLQKRCLTGGSMALSQHVAQLWSMVKLSVL